MRTHTVLARWKGFYYTLSTERGKYIGAVTELGSAAHALVRAQLGRGNVFFKVVRK